MKGPTLSEIESRIEELTPKIEQLTGISIPAQLQVKLVEREHFWEEAMAPGLIAKGISPEPRSDMARGLIELTNKLQSIGVGGMYEPSLTTLYIFPENIEQANSGGRNLVVGHELVHSAQLSHCSRFTDLVERLTRMYAGLNFLERDNEEVPEALSPLSKMMTYTEGYAKLYESLLKANFYPDAQYEARLGFLGSLQLIKDIWEIRRDYPEIWKMEEPLQQGVVVDKQSQYRIGEQMMYGIYISAEMSRRGSGPAATLAAFDDPSDMAEQFISRYEARKNAHGKRISDILSRL